ncbi:hypothetical protein [Bradyrhizobium sp. BWA-3-5]|uniref:hypothetical protein n=1 Tax=Bradyrhizobium sp. BWA-3-5 TaxID=3080013 RepID=UPI00293E964C|nr:hypothetical protein [Bradyrhizobium sp. BWA-3-5]WOH67660.1 hypothetical protein RX331_07905 [Bradyrhizobium sp. BWA-3-5]
MVQARTVEAVKAIDCPLMDCVAQMIALRVSRAGSSEGELRKAGFGIFSSQGEKCFVAKEICFTVHGC